MTVPTQGETYAKLMEHLRLAQEDAAMLAHLHNAMDHSGHLAKAWLAVSEGFKTQQLIITQLAKRGFQ